MKALVAALAGLAVPLAAQQPASVTNAHVTISLVPEYTGVTPGQPLRVAVRFQPEPGWHVYWRNPGQSGIPTTVRWILPAGFTADSLAWPVPTLYDISGILTHILPGESALLAKVRPPASAVASPVRIGAEVRYGVCKEVCLAGQATVGVELGWAGSRASRVESREWRAAAAAAEARRPRTDGPEVRVALRDTMLVMTVRARPGQPLPDTLTFFASDRDVLPAAASVAVPRGAASAVLRMALLETPTRVRGVLVGGGPSAARPRGWAVSVEVRSKE